LARGDRDGDAADLAALDLDGREVEGLPEARDEVDMEALDRRNILNCGILAGQILGRDLVDARVIEYGVQRSSKARDIVGIGGEEEVDVARATCEAPASSSRRRR